MPQTIQQILLPSNQKIDPREAELLLAHTLDTTREFIIAHPEKTIDKTHIVKYKKLLQKRQQGVPLAYLTGHKEFFGLDFVVNKNVLIPRPETEMIVSLTLDKIKEQRTKNKEQIILIDVGTGSGCIPISILKNLQTYKLTHLQTFATDISANALLVARKNARHHNVKIKFLYGHLLSPISYLFSNKTYNLKPQTYNLIITANLPYLTPEQVREEKSIQHEPRLALVAGKDGLKYYRELFKQIKVFYKLYNFTNFITFIEIDPSQTKSIKLLIKKYLPKAKITFKKDLRGQNRVVIINLSC